MNRTNLNQPIGLGFFLFNNVTGISSISDCSDAEYSSVKTAFISDCLDNQDEDRYNAATVFQSSTGRCFIDRYFDSNTGYTYFGVGMNLGLDGEAFASYRCTMDDDDPAYLRKRISDIVTLMQ